MRHQTCMYDAYNTYVCREIEKLKMNIRKTGLSRFFPTQTQNRSIYYKQYYLVLRSVLLYICYAYAALSLQPGPRAHGSTLLADAYKYRYTNDMIQADASHTSEGLRMNDTYVYVTNYSSSIIASRRGSNRTVWSRDCHHCCCHKLHTKS